MDKIIQESAIGLFKKSDIGHPMRLYYYLSPQDLIWYGNSLIENISEEMVLKYELGSYLTISLQKLPSKLSKLPDCSLLRTEQNIEKYLLNLHFNQCGLNFLILIIVNYYLIQINNIKVTKYLELF